MQDIIAGFYRAFGELNAEDMIVLYHDKIVFKDPAFGKLHGERAKNMWRMLCESQKEKDFVVKADEIAFKDGKGSALWEAHYTFSKTGRKVHNKIKASFRFRDDKIIEHVDDFNLHRWARMAMGLTGSLLGWTPMFQNRLQKQTNRLLDKYIDKSGSKF